MPETRTETEPTETEPYNPTATDQLLAASYPATYILCGGTLEPGPTRKAEAAKKG